MKRIKLLAVLALSIVLLTANAGRAFAANSTNITLSGGNAQVGNSLTVFITENSGSTTINLVTVNLSYDSSKLQFVEFNESGSEFDYKGAQSAGAGNVSVKRGLYGGAYTGSHRVSGVTFKAIAAGSASVSVTSATVTNPQAPTEVEWNGQKNGTTATLTAAPVANQPAASNPSAGSNGSSSSSSSNASTKKTVTTATGATATASNGSSSTSSNGTESTTAASTEVKGDSTEKKAEDNKKSDDKKQAKAEDGSNLLVRLFTLLIAGLVAFFAGRYVARYMANRNKQTKTPLAEAVVAAKAADKKSAAKKKPATKKIAKKAKK